MNHWQNTHLQKYNEQKFSAFPGLSLIKLINLIQVLFYWLLCKTTTLCFGLPTMATVGESLVNLSIYLMNQVETGNSCCGDEGGGLRCKTERRHIGTFRLGE